MRALGLVLAAAACVVACGCGDRDGAGGGAEHWKPVAPGAVSERQNQEASRLGVPVAFENDLGMRFVLIPPGTFRMGSPDDEPERFENEGPRHDVTISKAFYLAVTEVTNAQYRRFHPKHAPPRSANLPGAFLLDARPVTWVASSDADAFGREVSKAEPGHKYRLPTEAEWEYACRAGTSTAFWWGDQPRADGAAFNGEAPYAGKSGTGSRALFPAPVGSFPPNAFGLHDMHGNVWEWVADGYAAYGGAAVTDPFVPPGNLRLLRGGSWFDTPKALRSAVRNVIDPTRANELSGLRLAADVPRK